MSISRSNLILGSVATISLIVVIVLLSTNLKSCNNKTDSTFIDYLESKNKENNRIVDSLIKNGSINFDQKNQEIIKSMDSILLLRKDKEIIKEITKYYDKKIDNMRNIGVDSNILFFSSWTTEKSRN